MTAPAFNKPDVARYAPFAVFMVCIGIEEALRHLIGKGFLALSPVVLSYAYPVKVVCASIALLWFYRAYRELSFRDLAHLPTTLLSCATGILVFILWINMPWTFGSHTPQGFNPTVLSDGSRLFLTAARICGAVLVVPIMEELFWRSFLIRYIINPDFEKVEMGRFTVPSFLITVILFGLEHHYILAGIMAGICYTILLYRTRSLAHCILAHAVTNAALAAYVLRTGAWQFW